MALLKAQNPNIIEPCIPDPFASNLNKGDSYVNITNTSSAIEEDLAAPIDGSVGAGNICANVYVFDPAEEILSC